MAKTVAFGRLPRNAGTGIRVAVGTVASMSDGGSFAPQLDSAGSVAMRNILAVLLSNIGSQTVQAAGQGSSNGYVSVSMNRLGTSGPAVPGGTVDLNYIVFGGGGSV